MLTTLLFRMLGNVFIFLILAKYLNAADFGLFIYVFTLALLLAIIVDYGFPLKLYRDLSKGKGDFDTLIHDSYNVKVLLSVGLSLVAVIIYVFSDISFYFYFIVIFAAVINSFCIFYTIPLRAVENFKLDTLISVVGNGALFILVMMALYLNGSIEAIATAIFISRLFNLIFVRKCLARYMNTLPSILKFPINRMPLDVFRSNFPFAIHLAVGTLYIQLDTIIIRNILGDIDVGIYQSAFRIFLGLLIFSEVLNNIYIPRLAKFSESVSSLLTESKMMYRYLLLLGAVISLSLFSSADVLVAILYGQANPDIILLVKLFTVALLFRYISSVNATLLTISDKQKIRVISVSIVLSISIVLNLLIIPIYGIMGAGVIVVVSSILLSISYELLTVFTYKRTFLTYDVLISFFILLIGYGLLYVFNYYFALDLLIRIVSSVSVLLITFVVMAQVLKIKFKDVRLS